MTMYSAAARPLQHQQSAVAEEQKVERDSIHKQVRLLDFKLPASVQRGTRWDS
jgi:hypothetical protein